VKALEFGAAARPTGAGNATVERDSNKSEQNERIFEWFSRVGGVVRGVWRVSGRVSPLRFAEENFRWMFEEVSAAQG
jgi:hypothetical protein